MRQIIRYGWNECNQKFLAWETVISLTRKRLLQRFMFCGEDNSSAYPGVPHSYEFSWGNHMKQICPAFFITWLCMCEWGGNIRWYQKTDKAPSLLSLAKIDYSIPYGILMICVPNYLIISGREHLAAQKPAHVYKATAEVHEYILWLAPSSHTV